MATAYIGLGSNVGDRLGNVASAVEAVGRIPFTHVDKVSHAYESAAAYLEDQPDFVNAVVEVSTGMEPEPLLEHLLRIEDEMGRARDVDNGPRTIDLDLLLFDTEEISSPVLTVPHEGLAERAFVVWPLLEIAPGLHLPNGERIQRAHATLGEVRRDLGPVPDAGAAHNMPVEPTEWVAVAESEWANDVVAGWDTLLLLKREVLETEGIPFAYEPYEPGSDMDPFGLQMTFKLLVPVAYAESAKALLDQVEHAPIEYPEGAGPL